MKWTNIGITLTSQTGVSALRYISAAGSVVYLHSNFSDGPDGTDVLRKADA